LDEKEKFFFSNKPTTKINFIERIICQKVAEKSISLF
jgi:hypothetical protein